MKRSIIFLIIMIILTSVLLSGCAAWNNDVKKSGGWLGSYPSDYVVINYSGDKIMDVWKLRNVYVQSESGSDGWNFIEASGNVIMLGGDVKIIRIYDATTFDRYVEYHYEYNGGNYFEFFMEGK